MTQEHKELLLKDLCSRLPHGVILEHKGNLSRLDTIFMCDSISISSTSIDKNLLYNLDLDEIKPYLFPLSSMTEEQRLFYCTDLNYLPYYQRVDWFNKNHLDYRELISLELALDATDLNVY